jgi:hypothetical protein
LEAAAGTALEPGIIAVIQTFGDRINFHRYVELHIRGGSFPKHALRLSR